MRCGRGRKSGSTEQRHDTRQPLGLGDLAPLGGVLLHAGARGDRHRVLHAARAQRGPDLHHQDHGGADTVAGRDSARHAAAGHRTHRAQAAGNAAPRLPEKLHHGGSVDGVRLPEGVDRAEGGFGHLVPGTQEDQGHRADPAPGRHRAGRQTTNSATPTASSMASPPMGSPVASCATTWRIFVRGCCRCRMSPRWT